MFLRFRFHLQVNRGACSGGSEELFQIIVQGRHFPNGIQGMVRCADLPDLRGTHDLIDGIAEPSVFWTIIIPIRAGKDLMAGAFYCPISLNIRVYDLVEVLFVPANER